MKRLCEQDSEGGGYRWNDMIRLGRASNDSITRIQKFMFATGCAMGKVTIFSMQKRQRLKQGCNS